MTREEAIRQIENRWSIMDYGESEALGEALDMAIEALQEPTKSVPLSLADVYKWERDIALSQLEEYGIGFAEKKRDDLVEVVRCKDCRQKHIGGSVTHYYWCDLWDREVDCNNYCSWGERREP